MMLARKNNTKGGTDHLNLRYFSVDEKKKSGLGLLSLHFLVLLRMKLSLCCKSWSFCSSTGN